MGIQRIRTEYGILVYHTYELSSGNKRLTNIYAFDLDSEPVKLFIPLDVTYHVGWGMYDQFDQLETLIAHPDSPVYETIDGVLYEKRWSELLYVPCAKTALHIPKKITRIGYDAFHGRRLTEITVDEDHPAFCVVDGVLYDKEMTKLYYIPYPERTLYIPRSVIWLNKDVPLYRMDSIIVEKGNPVFRMHNGILLENEKFRYVLSSVTTLYLSNHPTFADHFQIPPQIDEIICSDHMTAFPKELTGYKWDLKRLSVPSDITIPKKAFPKSSDTIIHIRRQDGAELAIPLNGRSPRFWLHLLRSNDYGIKPDLALFWLQVYLSGWTHDSILCANLRRSFYMIGRMLIDADDTAQMKAVLEDGTLLSDKHFRRLSGYARECGSLEITALLSSYNTERIYDYEI